MKVTTEVIADIKEVEVLVRYCEETSEVRILLHTLEYLEGTIIGRRDETSYPLRRSEVFYFESVDDRVYANTESETFDVKMKLYELERMLPDSQFVRVSISVILNVGKIANFKSSLNGRMEARLTNGDMIQITRNYVPALKKILGGHRHD